jgi:acyl-CoA thioester hydrolase
MSSCDGREGTREVTFVNDIEDNPLGMTWHELTRGIVMPAHCDVYGHMNVRHYAAFFDDAGWHMFGTAGISLGQLHASGLGSVVASLTIDFHHELKAGELTLVRGAFTRVGGKSFEYEMRLFAADSMTHCATQKTVEVCFDTSARRSAALPDEVRARILQAVEA